MSMPIPTSLRWRRGRLGRRALLGAVVACGLAMQGSLPASAVTATTVKKKTATTVAAACDGTVGWSAYSGAAAGFAPGAALGLYVWNQKGTWVVAATGPDRKQHLFQGTITFDAPVSAKAVGLEGKSDIATVNATSVSFTFKNFGRVDSIAVSAACASTVTVTATLDGAPLPPTQLFLGPGASAAASLPAVLRKDLASTTLPATPDPVTCAQNPWPANVLGRPAGLKKLKGATVYLWNDKAAGTWQVALVGDGTAKSPLVEGRIVFDSPIAIQLGKLSADNIRVDGTTVLFAAKAPKAAAGFAITAPCASRLTLEVTVDGSPIDPAQVLVGAAAAPAPALPFVASR